jgi:hypothetical protein
MKKRYYLQYRNPENGILAQPKEVSVKEFIQAEKDATIFQACQRDNIPATSAFYGLDGMRGWTEYLHDEEK